MFCALSSNFLAVKHTSLWCWSIVANLMRGENMGQEPYSPLTYPPPETRGCDPGAYINRWFPLVSLNQATY